MNDYILYAGDDKEIKLKVYKRSGGLFDLTGSEILFSLSKNRYAEASIILATPNQIEITDAENGAAVVHLDSGVTYGHAGKWVYEVDVVKGGRSQIVASGTITILESTLRQTHTDSVDAVVEYVTRAEEAAGLAEDYADSAEDYAADASESAADALGYKDDVVTAANTASAAADAAAISAGAASDSADAAAASASAAAEDAEAIADALSSITTTVEDIEEAVSGVADYVTSAEQSATAAAASESNAETYASQASDSADAAAASAAEVAESYLPLSGGTLTGQTFREVDSSRKLGILCKNGSADDDYYIGWAGADNGGRIHLYGSEATSPNAGTFRLVAKDSSNSLSLIGKPSASASGSLTWGAQAVVTVASSGAGYVRYSNGLQICWGLVIGLEAQTTINFAVSFASNTTPTVTCATNSSNTIWVSSPNITSFKANAATYSSSVRFHWIAIGTWS